MDTVFWEKPTPAQFTQTLSCPILSLIDFRPSETDFGSDTSTFSNITPYLLATFNPSSSFISKIATFAPSDTNFSTTANPSPDAPPVTNTPVSLEIFMVFL